MTKRQPKRRTVTTHEIHAVVPPAGNDTDLYLYELRQVTDHQVQSRGGRWSTELGPAAVPMSSVKTVTTFTRPQLAAVIGEAAWALAQD